MMHNYLWKVQMRTQPEDLISREPEVRFIVKVRLQVVEIVGKYIHLWRGITEKAMTRVVF